jgi:peptide/nickel transport system permease protein
MLRTRLLRLIPVLIIVTFATFAMVRLLPGDPAIAFLGPDAPPENIAVMRSKMGLDRNVFVGYVDWIGGVVKGDLGTSFRNEDISVVETLRSRIPVSLELMIITQLFSLLLAIPIGVLTAYRSGRFFDRIWSGAAFGIIALPGFVLAMLLIYLVPIRFGWLQISGYTRLTENVKDNLSSLILPALTLSLAQIAIYSRILRSDMVATLQQDYVTIARAKGLSTRRVLFGHALRPSSFSLLTLAGMNVGQLISGAVIVESIFGLPGIGSMFIEAIFSREIFMLQGAMLFIVVAYVMVNLFVDATYSFLDPRIRHVSQR